MQAKAELDSYTLSLENILFSLAGRQYKIAFYSFIATSYSFFEIAISEFKQTFEF